MQKIYVNRDYLLCKQKGYETHTGGCLCLHGQSIFRKNPRDSNNTGCLWGNDLDGRVQGWDFSLYNLWTVESWTMCIYYSFKNNKFLIKYMKYIHKGISSYGLEADPPGTPRHLAKHQPEPPLQSCSPVAFFGILQSQLLELLIHLFVEVISEKEGPKAEESVHLLRLANAQAFTLWWGRKKERCVSGSGCLCFRGENDPGAQGPQSFLRHLPIPLFITSLFSL